jgi:hypothetical protein
MRWAKLNRLAVHLGGNECRPPVAHLMPDLRNRVIIGRDLAV